MIYRYVFLNQTTGETREAVSASLHAAARFAGLPLEGGADERKLMAPWKPWECWTARHECLWHIDAEGLEAVACNLHKSMHMCLYGARKDRKSSRIARR